MKIIKALIPLVLALSLLLCACRTDAGDNKINSENTPPSNDDVIEDEGKDYTEIECRVPSEYSSNSFSFADKRLALSFSHPADWSFEKNSEGGFDILRDGSKIGTVSREADYDENWDSVKRKTVATDDYSVKYRIEKNISQKDTYRYSLEYSYTEDLVDMSMVLHIVYEEVCEEALEKLFYETKIISFTTEPNLAVLSDIPRDRPVVFIGNSFIGSSQVATIFKEMLSREGKSLTVTTRAYGGAQLADFADNTSLINEIKSGSFGTIFLCGFYGYSRTDMQKIVDACALGDTTLVVFPAHNEYDSSIELAKKHFPDVVHLNWKAEIDALIKNGVDPLDMYVEDAHHHSTTLAGYVGAQMVYRAIFGEIPTKTISNTISTSYVTAKLGTYTSTGFIYTVSRDGIFYID